MAEPSTLSGAFQRGLAKRVERGVAGEGKGGLDLKGLEQILTVALSAGATKYWNGSRPPASRGTWQVGEIGLGLVVGAGTQGALNRVAAGVVTGAILDMLSGGGTGQQVIDYAPVNYSKLPAT